jgi:serine/tyrosine/threonine adenylyltransferase
MTLFFRNLSQINQENPIDFILQIAKDSYLLNDEFEAKREEWKGWLFNYIERLSIEKLTDEDRIQKMNLINPKYVLRNYMAQLAIDAADKGDYSVIDELYQLLKKPYDEQPEMQKWFSKRPDWANDKIGCSMLSCSS